MKTLNKALAAGILCSSAFTAQAAVQVINFDDVTTSPSATIIPDGYSNFDWDNSANGIYVADGAAAYPGSGYENGVISGNYVAFSGYDTSPYRVDWLGAGAIDFIGTYFTSAWSSSQTLSFEGWLNGNQVYTSTDYTINNINPTLIALGWSGIDSLVIHNRANNLSDDSRLHWAMDDFVFNNVSAVPEPSTYALMLGGLGLVGFMASRRRKQA